jgi:transcriptional regulator with XRE-family HTH domain
MKKPDSLLQLGGALRRMRAKLDHSQESFADSIRMHRAYYSAIERGEKNLSVRTLERIAAGMGTTLAAVFAEADI